MFVFGHVVVCRVYKRPCYLLFTDVLAVEYWAGLAYNKTVIA